MTKSGRYAIVAREIMKCGVKTIGVDTLPFMTILPALPDMRDKKDKKMPVLNHQDIID